MNGGVINTLRLSIITENQPLWIKAILTENDHSHTERDSGGTVW